MKNYALSIRYGIAMGGLLIGYFLIISLFEWHTNPLFSLFNGVITGFGIYEAVKGLKLRKPNSFTYAMGFTTGIVAGFIATLLFTVFFAFYASDVQPSFLENLVGPWNRTTSLGAAIFTVAVGGFTTSIVLTLSLMQLFKPTWNAHGHSAKEILQAMKQRDAVEI